MMGRKQIFTTCKDCVFAVYDENTQTDCKLDILSKFEKQNTEIMECYDEEKEFYVIKDRVCPMCRNREWAAKQKTNEHEELVNIARKEIQINYQAVILLKNNQLIKTLDSIMDQSILPTRIVIINKTSTSLGDLTKYCHTLTVPWKIEDLVSKDMNDNDAINLVLANHKKGMFYIVIDSGKRMSSKFINALDRLVNDELERFVLVEDKQCVAIPMMFHKVLGGIHNVKSYIGSDLPKLHL